MHDLAPIALFPTQTLALFGKNSSLLHTYIAILSLGGGGPTSASNQEIGQVIGGRDGVNVSRDIKGLAELGLITIAYSENRGRRVSITPVLSLTAGPLAAEVDPGNKTALSASLIPQSTSSSSLALQSNLNGYAPIPEDELDSTVKLIPSSLIPQSSSHIEAHPGAPGIEFNSGIREREKEGEREGGILPGSDLERPEEGTPEWLYAEVHAMVLGVTPGDDSMAENVGKQARLKLREKYLASEIHASYAALIGTDIAPKRWTASVATNLGKRKVRNELAEADIRAAAEASPPAAAASPQQRPPATPFPSWKQQRAAADAAAKQTERQKEAEFFARKQQEWLADGAR